MKLEEHLFLQKKKCFPVFQMAFPFFHQADLVSLLVSRLFHAFSVTFESHLLLLPMVGDGNTQELLQQSQLLGPVACACGDMRVRCVNSDFCLQKWLPMFFLAVAFVSWPSASAHCPQTAVSHCPPWILLTFHLCSLASTARGIPGLL